MGAGGCRAARLKRSRRKAARYESDEYEPLLEAVDAYLSQKRPPCDQCYTDYANASVVKNTEQAEKDLLPLRQIGASRFRARIQSISLFKRDATWYDLDYAIRKPCATKQQFDVTQIGELVQIDGCQLSLIQYSAGAD